MTNQGSTRIKGNALLFKLGDSDGTDYWADCSSVVLENADDNSGVLTFEDAANGGARAWQFTLSGIQSTASSSFWRYIWNNTGEEVAFTYAPHGNDTATADKPHFIGNVKIGPKPSIGGDASVDGQFTFDYTMEVTAGPTLDDGTVPEAWAATTAYAVDDKVTVSSDVLQCTTAGTSGSSAPDVSSTSVGDSVTDGTVTWLRVS